MIRAGFGNEFLSAGDKAVERLNELECPFLVLHGTKDSIVPPRSSEILIERAKSSDKRHVTYEGRLHEIMNEPNRGEVIKTIVSWVQDHIV